MREQTPHPGVRVAHSGEPRQGREERITASGIRIVGRATELLSERAAAGLLPPGGSELLLGAGLTLRPRIGASATAQAVAALSSAVQRAHPDYQPLERDAGASQRPDRAHALEWKVEADGDRWTGELLWRHPHPAIRGISLVTQVEVTEHPGRTRLAFLVGATGGVRVVGGPVGVGQSYPGFLAELLRLARVTFDGQEAEPRTVTDPEIPEFVRTVLLAEERVGPVLVVSPTEQGEFLVPPARLVEEFLGIAHVYVLDRHPTTFRLSDALGDRRLSCYWGAIRAYQASFSCADSPHEHPILTAERVLDPVVRAQLRGSLALGTRSRAPVIGRTTAPPVAPPTVGPPPAAVEPQAASAPVVNSPPALMAESGAVIGLGRKLDAVVEGLDRLAVLQARLLDEFTAMRASNAVRAATAAGLERRIGTLEEWLRNRLDDGHRPVTEDGEQAGAEAPGQARSGEEIAGDAEITVEEVVREATVSHGDALLILDPAIAAAEESPYEDVTRVAAVLDAMALVSRRRQAGTLGTGLREAFRDLGVDYRRGIADSTSERHRRQYQVELPGGEVVEAHEHIALGNSYDPRYCLRIYFTSRVPAEPRFVVAHVGRHFEVQSTN